MFEDQRSKVYHFLGSARSSHAFTREKRAENDISEEIEKNMRIVQNGMGARLTMCSIGRKQLD